MEYLYHIRGVCVEARFWHWKALLQHGGAYAYRIGRLLCIPHIDYERRAALALAWRWIYRLITVMEIDIRDGIMQVHSRIHPTCQGSYGILA
jgi:hypothetical protein